MKKKIEATMTTAATKKSIPDTSMQEKKILRENPTERANIIEKSDMVNYYDKLNVLAYKEENVFVEHEERNINVDYLNFIVNNKDIFEPLLLNDKDIKHKGTKIESFDPLDLAKKYLNLSRQGNIKVRYKQKRGVGRFFAKHSLSLQCLKRSIRQTIATDYIDIDISNAHPNILKFICEENNIECNILTKYCNNRNKFFEDNDLTKEDGKMLFLSIINGGNAEYSKISEPSSDLEQFYNYEITDIHNKISKKHNDLYKEHKQKREDDGITFNHKASFMNVILCDIENKILQHMYDFFGKMYDCVLCFDGIMLRKGIEYNLTECEKYVFDKLHINIKLMIKPFEEAFDMTKYTIPKYTEMSLSYFRDYNNLLGYDVPLELATEWLNNAITLIINNGSRYFLTKNKAIDGLTKLEREYQSNIPIDELLRTLKIVCNILNPDYDYDYWQKHKDHKKNEIIINEKMNKYLFTRLGENNKQEKGFMINYLELNKIKNYNSVDFIPFLARKGAPVLYDCFNLFTGFPMECVTQTKNIDFEKSALYKHIKEELMNNNIDEFNHFLDHIADMIQDPANIKTNGHMFYTRQGNGKGLLAEFVSKLIGPDHFISFENTDAYFGNFNADHANKILKVFEEVSDKGTAFKNHDRLKGDQSKKYERIEPKGVNAYQLRHCARYWYFTNNPQALHIEGDDRRVTCHKSSNKYANNIEYFAPIWDEIRDIQFCKAAFEYFATRNYTFKSVSSCFENDFKKDQKEMNLCSTHQFLKYFVENGWDIKSDKSKIKCTDLTEEYSNWCKTTGTDFKQQTFKTQLAKLDIVSHKVRYNGIGTRCYILDPTILKQKFSVLLNDPNFEFKGDDYIDEAIEEFISNAKDHKKVTKTQKRIKDDSSSTHQGNKAIPCEFVENESIDHKTAKELLIKWLHNDNKIISLSCKINGILRHFTFSQEYFFVEYPVTVCKNLNSLIVLWNNKYKNYEAKCDDTGQCIPSPTFGWCKKKKICPKYIFDIAISENGRIVCGIEIVKTHEISEEKRRMIQETIKGTSCEIVIEISADWILGQQEKPNVFKLEKYISADQYIISNNAD